MADLADVANDSADLFLELSLAARKTQAAVRDSLTECLDCGDPIPEARRLAAKGCERCIDCQWDVDKKGLRHAG